jgi:hypothetical protein
MSKDVNYYDRDLLSHSKLKKLSVSYNEFMNPFEKKVSEALIMGSLMDEGLLEPDLYSKRKVSEYNLKQKGYEKHYLEADSHKYDIPKNVAPKIKTGLEIVKNHPLYYLLEGDVQTEIFETLNGESCKSKLDVLNLNKSRIIDFKTTSKDISNINPYYWVRNWFYHTQLAFYRQMVNKCYSVNIEECILFVYSWSNQDVRVFKLSDETLQQADKIIDGWFDKLGSIKIDGAFKGMSDEIEII